MKGSGTRRSEKILLASRAVPASTDTPMDLVTLGQRLRHLRRAKGMTLDQLSAAVGRAPSQLSLIENGKREPRPAAARRRPRVAHRAAPRADPAADRAERDAGAGPPGERPAAPGDARAGQLLRRHRAGGRHGV